MKNKEDITVDVVDKVVDFVNSLTEDEKVVFYQAFLLDSAFWTVFERSLRKNEKPPHQK